MDSYAPHLDWIHTQEHRLLQRVKEWVDINTHSFHLEGLSRLLQILRHAFKPLSGEENIVDLPPQQLLSADGTLQSRALGQALVIRKRPQAPIQVLLGGHIDTVYPVSGSFQKMEELQPGIWQGPGAADMKGGLSILLTTLEAFERSSFAEQLGWEIILNPDEEIGSPGSASLFKLAAARHQLGLIFEPAFPDGAFACQRKGSINYTIVVKGRSAHAGRDFTQGRSAVFSLVRLIYELEEFKQRNDLIVNVADLEGKGPVNIVPPLASCRINLRSSDPATLTWAVGKLERLVEQTRQEEGIQVNAVQDSSRLPKLFDFKTQRLFEAYASCAHDLKIPFQTRETGGVCDGNILASEGLPTLDTAGVVGGALHTPDEYLIASSLAERAKLGALFLFKLASREILLNE